ncbi:MAG: circularly permuted type 2 ATP-grasp protein, partial [Rhodospirillales bacterium]
MQFRAEEAARLVREHGITYHVYDDPMGAYRPAGLEPVPFMLDFHEWKRLEAGLAQRATLLNAILSDIYGDQRLIREGEIPASMVFSHEGFLRPAHGMRPPGDVWLNLYAVDLSRSPDGRWWVISDRTQAPSGAGYALENRIISAQVLNTPFRKCRVTRLAPFFSRIIDAAREMAGLLADPPTAAPNIALLSPGPLNETYFEHAFLARYLNFSLVEGADLTVRENKVYMKTLGGLERVHVILRRMDDSYCDPLWLRSNS